MLYFLVCPENALQNYNMFKTQQEEFSPPPGILLKLLLCFMTFTGYPWHHVFTLRYYF